MTVWQDVRSDMFSEVGHDPDTNELSVRFRSNGRQYSSPDVTPEQFQEFLNAPSLGRYWREHWKVS